MLGLVVGISFSCMLYVYVQHELSYDTFHEKSDRIYRVLTIDKRVPENPRTYGVTVPAISDALVNTYPQVTDRVRLHRLVGQVVFEIDGENFQERNWFTTDPNFFKVFDFNLISGDKATALSHPFSLVLTQSAAKKYFGEQDPVGKVIDQTSFGPIKVTGVMEDLPDNSHLQFDFLFSRVVADSAWTTYLNSWEDFEAYTYIVLDRQNNIHDIKVAMPEFTKAHFGEGAESLAIDFQALKDIYLGSSGMEASIQSRYGQLSYIYIFGSMGIFILLIACINYINLSTSRAVARAREIGVRKVVGAAKVQLMTQFLTESVILALISMTLAIGAMDIAFPYFNSITGKTFDISLDNLSEYLPSLFIITLLIGLIAGSYPAFYLARLKPVSSLKGKLPWSSGKFRLRETLVVFQFTLTMVMIISTLVIGNQLNYVRTMDIGYNKERLMIIDINSGNVRKKFQVMKDEYAQIPGVSHVAVSSRVPGEWKNIIELYATTSERTDSVRSYFMGFDESMLQTYEFKLTEGNFFPENSHVDSTDVLLNESAVKALGLHNPVGAVVRFNAGGGRLNATVVGVLKDFNFQSLHQKVEPIIIGTWNNPIQSIDYFTVKITGDVQEVVTAATTVHEKFDHRTPIEYHFLDEQLNSYYNAETRVGNIFRMGGALGIFVACLGLFGLAIYTIERRTKELGIRKVMGATTANLFLLLSSTFTKQVGIAFTIGAPLAYLIMKDWLKAFAYQTDMPLSIFLLSGLIVLAIAMLTISYRTLKAVYTNPVNSLKEE